MAQTQRRHDGDTTAQVPHSRRLAGVPRSHHRPATRDDGDVPDDPTTAPSAPASASRAERRDAAYWSLRGLTAAGLLVSALVHLVLYGQGWSDLRGIGPLFLLNGVAGVVGAVAVLVWRHWVPLVAALAFGAATLAAYYVSYVWGLFDVQDTVVGTSQVLAAVAEWVVVVASVVALVRERRR